MAQLADVLVEPRAGTAVVLGEIFQRRDETRERELFVVFARLRLDGQKLPAFGVEDEKQPVEKDEAGVVNARQIGVGDFVFRALGETVGEDFDDGEDALAQVLFELRLRGERAFADVIESALALRVAHERGGTEEREKKFEGFERLNR